MEFIKKTYLIAFSGLIFLLMISGVCAQDIDNNTVNLVSDNSNYELDTSTDVFDELQLNNDDNPLSDDQSSYYEGQVIKNPGFEEGNVGSAQDVYGWVVSDDNRITISQNLDYGFYKLEVSHSGNNALNFPATGKTSVRINGTGPWVDVPTNPPSIAQYINFDTINNISFYAKSQQNPFNINVTIDDLFLNTYEVTNIWNQYTIDTTNIVGNHFLNISRATLDYYEVEGYLDDFSVGYNDLTHSNFTYDVVNIDGNNIEIQFNNEALGLIKDFLWEFDDQTTSNDVNPTHIFKSGTHTVTLTASNENNSNSYSMNLLLEFPTINGQMYATLQDAITAANAGDEIDIPTDFSGALNIAKNLTLNFNDNKLSTSTINVVNGALVTINDVAFDGENTLSTDESSTINVYSAQATDANVTLSNGNIILEESSFENSYLTIANANVEINYCNVNASGIIINGGKSKITNSEFTNCDVAVSQNDGELNLTSNLFTTNKIAVNATNGTGNINFNAIYANTVFGLVYKGNINIDNNWFGKDDEIIYLNGNETPTEYADVYQAEETSSDVVFLVLTISSPEVMGANKEYDIVFDLTMNSKGQNTTNMESLKSLSLDVTSSNGDVEPLYLADGIGVTTIHVGDSASEGIDYTILGKTYTTESIVVTNPEINITATVEETNANVVVTIPYATGNVSLIIDKDKYEKVLDGKNTVSQTIDNLIAGTHNIVVIYHGDNVFDYTIQTDSFDVIKSTADLINELDNQNKTIKNLTEKIDAFNDTITEKDKVIAGKDAEISNLTDTVKTQNSTIETQAKEISNLTDTVKTQNSTIDSQKALINNLNETIIEQNTNKTSNPIATSISVKDITTTATTATYFTISLLDANNETLVNKTIKYTVNGKTDSVTTNGSGIATVKVSYSTAGTRYYTFSFLGDEKYSASIATAKVVVNKKATKITAPKKTFKVKTKTKKVQIKLTSGKTVLKSKKVTLKVKGKTYTAKTNKKGIATFKITKLTKKGNFKYTVKFAGDKAYKAINKNGKIIVK
ncbi:PKD domain-containing protein [Methanobrevibacter thaueri]|uniref:PKD domain-containing protein n=1 Tax=Methanobrevibacter thaueri TaxID=190975 RepID=UPI00386F76C4